MYFKSRKHLENLMRSKQIYSTEPATQKDYPPWDQNLIEGYMFLE